MLPIDLESLDPVQRMELADVLYDSAMQAIDDRMAFTPEQRAEMDRRIGLLHTGASSLKTWESVLNKISFGS